MHVFGIKAANEHHLCIIIQICSTERTEQTRFSLGLIRSNEIYLYYRPLKHNRQNLTYS